MPNENTPLQSESREAGCMNWLCGHKWAVAGLAIVAAAAFIGLGVFLRNGPSGRHDTIEAGWDFPSP